MGEEGGRPAGVTVAWPQGARLWARAVGEGVAAVRLAWGDDRAGLPPGAVPALDGDAAVARPVGEKGEFAADNVAVAWDAVRRSLVIADGAGRVLVAVPPEGLNAAPGRACADVLLADGAEVLGLGAKMGPFARRGGRYRFWNTDMHPHTPDADPMYASLPFALVVAGGEACGLALVWGGESQWDVGRQRPDRMRVSTRGGGLELVALAGPQPADVMARLARLFGPYALPPLWALGYQQSHWGYGDAGTVLEVVRTFRALDLPLDAVYLDLDYEERGRPLTWDRERFPDPASFVASLHAAGVRVVLISNAGVALDDPRYAAAEAAGALVREAGGEVATGALWAGRTAVTDFLQPRAHALWHGFYAEAARLGVDGIWNDMNEPSFIASEGDGPDSRTLPDDAVHVGADGCTWRHDTVHNAFALFMNRATFESLARHRPGQRPFVLSRAGYLGVGRYAALWTGDNASWWEHLRATLPTVMGMSLSGAPLAGVDIGGFDGEATPELFARWIAAGSLMPLCRNHSSIHSSHQEPYAFGPEVEAIARRHLRRRYALLPTLYALAYAAHAVGEPIWRPLGYGFPNDPLALRLEDEVMVGPDLLMAPVLTPATEARAVYLPTGRWYRIDGGVQGPMDGPGYHLAPAPLDALPLYARGGTILAVDPEPGQRARLGGRIDLVLFPEGRGELCLFEDDGESELDRGSHRLTRLTWRAGAEGGRLEVRRQGGWLGADLYLRLPPGLRLSSAQADGVSLGEEARLPAGDAVDVEVRWRGSVGGPWWR
ncbi:MAG: alpha-glucosidase [Firmicutes bacterium]|nr:alpha-glucosidase [Bacillota bacterium]